MKRFLVSIAVATGVVLGGVPVASALSHGAEHRAPVTNHATAVLGVAKGHDAPGKRSADRGHAGTGSAHAAQMRKIAAAHRDGMKAWGVCVRGAARAGEQHPTRGCVKPTPPGWVKHPGQHSDDEPGASSHGRSH